MQVDSTGLFWTITDHCSAFRHRLLLRWRLCPTDWQLQIDAASADLRSDQAQISVECNRPILRLELVVGWESLFYAQKTPLPVLELEVAAATTPVLITTHIALPAQP